MDLAEGERGGKSHSCNSDKEPKNLCLALWLFAKGPYENLLLKNVLACYGARHFTKKN